jgi:hypothetical protein
MADPGAPGLDGLTALAFPQRGRKNYTPNIAYSV